MSVSEGVPRDEPSRVERRIGETEAVRRALGLDHKSRWRRRIIWAVVLAALAGAIAFAVVRLSAPAPAPRWLTAAVVRGELTTTVTATGSLRPVRTVAIAAEISGRIVAVHAEENDVVSVGQVLVEIDTERLQSQLAQARAQAAAARAAAREARVTAGEAKDELTRVTALAKKNLIAERELIAARAAHARALARIESATAQEALADAQVKSVETDLQKAVIRSPIDGVVLSRAVEPGTAVAASFQAPVLMTIAESLEQMELELDIDEADVGEVAAGQRASFTVDAFAEEEFPAEVMTVLFASKTVSNVVTYPARLSVDNRARRLRPGMTATATITTGVDRGVLLVPNAALRFAPPSEGRGGRAPFVGPMAPNRQAQTGEALARQNAPKVWVLRDGAPAPIEVVRGASDGRNTVVSGQGLGEGTLVLIGQETGGGEP